MQDLFFFQQQILPSTSLRHLILSTRGLKAHNDFSLLLSTSDQSDELSTVTEKKRLPVP